MLGQVVQNGTLSQQIDVSQLQAGLYILEVSTATEQTTKRFTKK